MNDPRLPIGMPDLAGAYMRGLEIRYARERNEREKAKAEADVAAQSAAMADMAARREQSMAEAKLAKTTEWQQRAARAIEANPSAAPFVQRTVDALAQKGEIEHFQLPGQYFLPEDQAGPQILPNKQEVATFGAMAGMAPAEKPADPYSKPTDDMLEYTASSGKRPGDAGYEAGFRAFMKQKDASRGVKVSVDARTGSVDASQKTVGGQEETLLDAQDQLALLEDIAKLATPQGASAPDFSQFLGWVPKGKKFALDVLDSVSPESVPAEARDWYEKMSQFRSYVDEYKAGRYNKLLGSAQSQSEVRNLMNAVLSADMGTTQFNAAYGRMMNVLPRKIRIAEQVLNEGIPIGGRQYRERFAQIERGEAGTAAPSVGASPAPSAVPTPEQIVDEAIRKGEVPADQRAAAIDALKKKVSR